jgi:hypothetical protein
MSEISYSRGGKNVWATAIYIAISHDLKPYAPAKRYAISYRKVLLGFKYIAFDVVFPAVIDAPKTALFVTPVK